jgi:hypothetical protein
MKKDNATRVGKEYEYTFEGLTNLDELPCRELESYVFPNEFDAVFIYADDNEVHLQYGPSLISFPIKGFEEKVKNLKNGDIVSLRLS